MKDIFDIKQPLNLNLLNDNILLISFILSILLLLIFLLVRWHVNSYKLQEEINEKIKTLKDSFIETIDGLNPLESDFPQKLNFLLRSFLNDYKILPWSIRMTKNEILRRAQNKRLLEDFVIECEKAEFSKNKLTAQDSNNLKSKAIYIINNI
ncbi:MAG: hypothetical protein ACD_3C00216G0006 [uncultured bacterium (gcode 4)]|uniref:Uncharacterized protein n=1 Tax=uncultured bacterium (gcode 4) TaxID=1234023 RepID=K2FWK8_9BACT|nr:MAG: hypothetical protein ACD_3C00216G0006 [uncultured bacterium (gcode 4)]